MAVFTPGPPSSAGAAVYAQHLLPELTRRVRITAVSPRPLDWEVPTIPPARFRSEDHDLAVFMLGNHAGMVAAYRWAASMPGVTVWHDLVPHGQLRRLAPRLEFEALVDRFGRARAERLVAARQAGLGAPLAETFLFHLADRPLRRAHAAVVHNRHARHLVEAEMPVLPVHVVPMHHGVVVEGDRLATRAGLGLRAGDVAVGLLGHAGPHKRLRESVLGAGLAARRLRRRGCRLVLVVAGSVAADPAAVAALAESGLGDVISADAVDGTRFQALLQAVDVLLHLRTPQVGESSLVIAQAQRLGTPVVTSAVGGFAEVAGATLVPPGEGEVEAVAAALEHLATCPGCRSRAASAGRAAARGQTVERCADRYVEVFDSVLRDTPLGEASRPVPAPRTEQVGAPRRVLRVAVCAPHVPLAAGGMERLTQDLWRELSRRGHAAELVRVPLAAYSRAAVVRSAAAWRLTDLRPVGGTGFDVVIPTAFPSYFLRHPCKVTWLVAQFRQVYDLRDTDHARADWLRSQEWRDAVRDADVVALGESAALFSISRNVADRLRRFNGLEAIPLHPPPSVVREPSNRFGNTVLAVGRLDGLKRHDLLIDAMAHVTAAGARCVIVGTGVDAAALQQRIAEAGLGDRVELAGWVDDDRLRELYDEARAVFYGPLDEDLGLVSMEALSAGKPVITLRDSGGVLEFVEHGVSGWVVDAEARAVAAAVDAAFADDSLCRALGAAGRARIAPLAWDRVIDALLEPALRG